MKRVVLSLVLSCVFIFPLSAKDEDNNNELSEIGYCGSFNTESQYAAQLGDRVYINRTLDNWSEIDVYDLKSQKKLRTISLEKERAYFSAMRYHAELKKIVAVTMSNRIFLIDPDTDAAQDLGVLCGKAKAMPEGIFFSGSQMIVTTHEDLLSIFSIKDGTIRFVKNLNVCVKSALPVDDTRLFADYGNIQLIDSRTGNDTILVNLPEWTDGATPAEYLTYDAEHRVFFFVHAGSVYCYAANSDHPPVHSKQIAENERGMRINGGVLYRLDDEYYQYDRYNLGISVCNGTLSIISSDYHSEYQLTSVDPFQGAIKHLSKNNSVVLTEYSLLQARGYEQEGEIDPSFFSEISAKGVLAEQVYCASFRGVAISEFNPILKEDVALKTICGDELVYYSFPGKLRFYLLASAFRDKNEESLMGDVKLLMKGNNSSCYAFSPNPFVDDGERLLCVSECKNPATVKGEILKLFKQNAIGEIDPSKMTGKSDEILILFSARALASDLPELELKLKKHFEERYKGFSGLQKFNMQQ